MALCERFFYCKFEILRLLSCIAFQVANRTEISFLIKKNYLTKNLRLESREKLGFTLWIEKFQRKSHYKSFVVQHAIPFPEFCEDIWASLMI